jgi:DNA replication protein
MFKGFNEKETFTPVPNTFFQELLKEMDDAQELKITLHALWCVGNMEGPVRVLREEDFSAVVAEPASALEKAVARGTLLRVEHLGGSYYFLNTPRGRQAVEALQAGKLDPATLATSTPPAERPNLFKLYEQNIGPLTPLIADALKDAEVTYAPEWVSEAIEISAKNNKRSIRYIEAVLRRWKDEGHAQKQAGRNAQEDGRRYVTGEYGEFIEH